MLIKEYEIQTQVVLSVHVDVQIRIYIAHFKLPKRFIQHL